MHLTITISEVGDNCKRPERDKFEKDVHDFLSNKSKTVSTFLFHLIVDGVPACGKTTTIHKLLSNGLIELPPGETVATIGERNDTGFSFYELIALYPDDHEKHNKWAACTKYTFFTFCILSAFVCDAGSDCVVFRKPKEATDSPSFYQNPLISNHFKELYYRLYCFTNIPTFTSVTPESLQNLLHNGIGVVNMWDIGVNIALQQMLPQLAGYLHYSFSFLALSLDRDSGSLTKNVDISDKKYGSEQMDLDIIIKEKTKASYLFKFAQLARHAHAQGKNNQEKCKIVFLTKEHITREKQEEAETVMCTIILHSAEKFGISDLIDKNPILCNNESQDSVMSLRKEIEKFVEKQNKKEMPLSWMFLRSAACASGKMFIKFKEFKEMAVDCKVEDFEDFLTTFTAMGSLIYIPEIEVFKKYIVLNPFDFFHKLNELFRPRFNGDLHYGIIRMSSLRRMFGSGETSSFFQCLLKSCHFAIALDAKRIMYNETTEFISVEECFYVPTINTQAIQPKAMQHRALTVASYRL